MSNSNISRGPSHLWPRLEEERGLQPISLNALIADFNALKRAGVDYAWGEKPDPSTPPSLVHRSDCSGFVKYIMVRRIGGEFPDGSVAQGEWFRANCEEKKYADVLQYAKHDGGRLFVAGFNLGGNHRHIWFVIAGATMECGASLHGGGSRPAGEFLDEVEEAGWCCEIPVTLS